jgi:hypothetical protein
MLPGRFAILFNHVPDGVPDRNRPGLNGVNGLGRRRGDNLSLAPPSMHADECRPNDETGRQGSCHQAQEWISTSPPLNKTI